jgi:hypothetical protein
MPQQNNRLFWAIEAAAFAADGSASYTVGHGIQSVGMSMNFNLDPVLELGQLSIYEQIEEMPDVEVTVEKVLDGYPLIYHLGTMGSTGVDIINRSTHPSIMTMSLFPDTQTAASGTPVAQSVMSGLFFSNVSYRFQTEGNFTESVSFVGNHLAMVPAGSYTFSGNFNNQDVPLAETYGSGGIQRRVNFLFTGAAAAGVDANGQINATYANPATILPRDVQGISSSGTNDLVKADQYKCSVQSVEVSASSGRGKLLELGHRKPYFRFLELPVTVSTEITIISKSGHSIQALEVGPYANGFNTRNSTIKIALQDSTFINLGTKNRLSNLSIGGGDTSGANQTITYSYQTLNDFSVSHAQDQSGIN